MGSSILLVFFSLICAVGLFFVAMVMFDRFRSEQSHEDISEDF